MKDPISVTHPEIAAQLKDQSLGDVLTHGSHRRVWWVCGRSHEWEAVVKSRTGLGNGCPYCAGKRAIPGETDLATLRPDLARELKDQSLATQLMVGSRREVWWVCGRSHEWEAVVNHRTNGSGCPYCSGRRAIPGETDLATLRPDVACELKDPSLASQLTASSGRNVWWVCKDFGHEWEATVYSRTSGAGCPSCAKYGFDQTKPAWVYVVSQGSLHSEDTVMVKLGITNLDSLERRLNEHARQGLTEVLALSAYPSGKDAKDQETKFKKYLRDLRQEHRVSREELPDGYTEAFLSTAPSWEDYALATG